MEGNPESTGKDILGRKRINSSYCENKDINCQNNNPFSEVNKNKGGYSYCIPKYSTQYTANMEAIEMPKNNENALNLR